MAAVRCRTAMQQSKPCAPCAKTWWLSWNRLRGDRPNDEPRVLTRRADHVDVDDLHPYDAESARAAARLSPTIWHSTGYGEKAHQKHSDLAKKKRQPEPGITIIVNAMEAAGFMLNGPTQGMFSNKRSVWCIRQPPIAFGWM